ncbi:MAG TPA: hypothetical protein VGF14_02400, partial [Alphaproteobacteria bacterium]
IYLLQENVTIRAWREIYLKHLAFGRWLIGGAVVQFFSSNWLLMSGGAVLGAHAVGLIKSAQYLLGGVTMLFQALENVVPFKLARYYQKNDRVGRHDYLFKMSVFLFFFIILYVGLMLYLTPFFAHYLRIGNNDTASFIAVARLLLVQSVLYGPILMLTYMLRAQKLTRPIFLTHAVTAVVTVLAGPIIIPIWHEMAIVYGLGAIQVAVMIFFSIFVYRASKRDT